MKDRKLHFIRPEGFKEGLFVAGSFCIFEDKILLLKRHPEKLEGNAWCLPAGKVEQGERIIDAAVRETYEETGIVLEKNELVHLCDFYLKDPQMDFSFHVYFREFSKLPEVFLKEDESIDAVWLPFEKALELPLITFGHAIITHCEMLRKKL